LDIEVVDQLDPVAVCTDIDIYLDEDGFASIEAEDVDGGSTDNCTGDG
jgi:large repetitive protein